MVLKKGILTQEKLKEILNYNPETGIFIWKGKSFRNKKVGREAGCKMSAGYIAIRINGRGYKAHILAWLYVEGYIPKGIEIDHIDRNTINNKFKNLRLSSRQCNMRNAGIPKNNKTGIKGVHWHKTNQKWGSSITVNKKQSYLGNYSDFDEAVCARLAAEQCLNWSSCDSNSPAFKYVQENIINKENKNDKRNS